MPSPTLWLPPLFVLIGTACQNLADPPASLFPRGGRGMNGLTMDFAGESLVGQVPARATALPDDLSAYTAELTRSPAWPVLFQAGDEFCLQLQNDFYFDLEAGLRLRVCRPVPGAAADEITQTLTRLRQIELPTAYPVYEDDNIRLEITRLAALKSRLGPVRASVDGSARGTTLRDAGLAGQLRFTSSITFKDPDEIFLPRRFPGAVAHWLVAEQSIVLLYPVARADEFLTIELRDPFLSGVVATGLGRIPALLEKRVKAAAASSADVTEIYFAAQGQAGEEWAEIAAPAADARLMYALATESSDLRGEFFAFAQSTAVIDRAQGLRLSGRLVVGGGEEIAYERLLDRGAGRFRSLARATSGDDSNPAPFHASVRCFSGALCGSPGIHPDLVRRLPGARQPPGGCTAADFRLSELNPFGIVNGDRTDPGGKFIEIQVLRPCQAGGVLFRAGETVLDPGFAFLAAGELLIFAASLDYFDSGESPGVRRFFKETGLVTFKTDDRVLALDVAETAEGTDPQTLELFAPPAGVTFLPESSAPGHPGIQARLHSLLPAEAPGAWPRFHRVVPGGLRPDLRDRHAMSPGRVAESTDFAETDTGAYLSEILPAGAFGPDGSSLAGAEFLEVYFPPGGTPRDDTLGLTIATATTTDLFLVPGPATLPAPFARHAAWTRQRDPCWNDVNVALAPALRLPNEPAEYTLRTRNRGLLDRVVVSRALYDLSQTSTERNSLTKIPGTDLWRPSAGNAARDHRCGARTAATPAGSAAYGPFFVEAGAGPAYRALRVFSLASGETVNWRIGSTLELPVRTGAEFTPAGSILTLSATGLSGRRLLTEARLDSVAGADGIFTGEIFPNGQSLYFETIAPTPSSGGHEWLRVCAHGDFLLPPGDELRIQDAQASDRIVPYGTRFAHSPPLPLAGTTLDLEAGRCAILIDPDLTAATRAYLPALNANDVTLWTIASSATIGNGLASGEGLRLLSQNAATTSVLASYGLPDTLAPFGLTSQSGQFVRRIPGATAGPRFDQPDAWEVTQ